jgi:NAD(P)-dependent dehydrogenase (short-subunit alcohol dehydrogenase family)
MATAPNTNSDGQQVALVTAGARRIGKAICLHLAGLGYDIALHYNSSESDAKVAQAEIRALGKKCLLLKRDFKDFPAVQNLIGEVTSEMAAPTVLVNNASLFVPNKLMTATPESFDTDMMVHVKAPFFLTQAFAQASRRGHIINMVDTAVLRYGTDFFTYLLTKKALFELTKMSARELAPAIRVNAIAPGIVLQPEGKDEAHFQFLLAANPLNREGSPADVVTALDYLVRNEQVTGQCLFVDGGDSIDY